MTSAKRNGSFRKGLQPTIKELRFTLTRILKSPISVAGLVLIIYNITIAVFAPVIAPNWTGIPTPDPYIIPRDPKAGFWLEPNAPNSKYLFGTTSAQVDLYYGCVWGTRFAFQLGLEVIVSTLLIGLILGLLAGYYGGFIDEVIMRFTDIILAFPGLILAMVFVSVLSKSGWTTINAAILSIIIIGWPGYTRLIRGEVLRVRGEDYVEAARASGASDLRIMTRHILPNSIYSVIIVASLDFGSIVLTAAALSFLGLGSPPGYSDWGRLIFDGVPYAGNGLQYWWTFIYPGIFIILFTLGWNLLGDALRDVLDPLSRRK
jgi:peptide/nickel transport system permease protein